MQNPQKRMPEAAPSSKASAATEPGRKCRKVWNMIRSSVHVIPRANQLIEGGEAILSLSLRMKKGVFPLMGQRNTDRGAGGLDSIKLF